MVALGVLNALSKLGRKTPDDFSVCGFDNIYLSKAMQPGLTSVDHLVNRRCRMAVDMVTENNESQINDILKVEYEPRLIIRETTGPAARKD